MNRADRRRRGERGPNPLRPPAPPISGRHPWPPVSTPRQWRRALLMLFAGLLLTALWIGLFDWSKHKPATPKASAASVHSVAAPALMQARELTREEREAKWERDKTAGRVLGLLHYLPIPLFFLLGVVCYQGMDRRLGETGSDACTRVATTGKVLCSIGFAMLAWRIAYVPLVDWIWQACGGNMIEYERSHSRKGHGGRRTGGSRDAPYQAGQLCAFAVWILVGWIYTKVDAYKTR